MAVRESPTLSFWGRPRTDLYETLNEIKRHNRKVRLAPAEVEKEIKTREEDSEAIEEKLRNLRLHYSRYDPRVADPLIDTFTKRNGTLKDEICTLRTELEIISEELNAEYNRLKISCTHFIKVYLDRDRHDPQYCNDISQLLFLLDGRYNTDAKRPKVWETTNMKSILFGEKGKNERYEFNIILLRIEEEDIKARIKEKLSVQNVKFDENLLLMACKENDILMLVKRK